MNVQAYLDRIGYSGVPRVDLATLRDLHRLHLQAIPYENFDVQLGWPGSLDPQAAYDKIVGGGRGGWCYEMNGLLAAMLREIGFTVTEMAGAVLRSERGESAHGNHLVLRVDLDQPYIADVGFGDGTLEPVPLSVGDYHCAGFDFRVERLEDGWLRFHNHTLGGAASFDFQDTPAERDQLEATAHWLRTSPESIFTQTVLAFRHHSGGVKSLLGRTLNQVTPTQKTSKTIETADEFVAVLRNEFSLDLPDAATLWPAICAKHDELFGADEPA